jgi:hypothetical protein
MRVYGEYDDVFAIEDLFEAPIVVYVYEFVFDSGIVGWKIMLDDYSVDEGIVQFTYRTQGRYVTFYINRAMVMQWYYENEELILSIVRSLRDVR